MITFETYIPKKLAGYVKSFWYLRTDSPNDTTYKEDMLPDGFHEMVFQLDPLRAKRTDLNRNWISEPQSFFAGQSLKSYSLELENDSILYGIRFHPHTLAPIFGFPANLATNQIISTEDIRGTSALRDCISEEPHTTFLNFESVLIRKIHQANLISNKFQYVKHAVSKIQHHQGNISIDELTESTGISSKYLDITFKEIVGINPKQLCGLIKLNHFVNYRNNHPTQSLTECAYQTNFYDQAHLSKVFKKITGRSPKEYFKGDNRINDYFAEE